MTSRGVNLVASFPGCGLFEYDGSSWNLLTASDSAADLAGVVFY
jgi:hypothetical protein